MSKEELIQLLLEALGFRRQVLPEGLAACLREIATATRDIDRERDRVRLLGIGTKLFFVAERILKDLVHFYGCWLHGSEYLPVLQRRGWVGAYCPSVLKLSFGALNQSFRGLAEELSQDSGRLRYFPARPPLLPAELAERMRKIEPHRNRAFSHDSPESRRMSGTELRAVTLLVHQTLLDFCNHLSAVGIYPCKLVLERTVQDRHCQTSYICLGEEGQEVEVVATQSPEPGQVYLCLSETNPKYVDPVLIPELAGP
jgi:hypothetical protein